MTRPVIISPPESSPHAFLDDLMSGEALERAIQRVNIDLKIARASTERPCEGCLDYGDCILADDVTAPARCERLRRVMGKSAGPTPRSGLRTAGDPLPNLKGGER
ncbi:MAG: hypothetical protein M0Q91_16295 [Methanoregula sp.]|jgi:hypothetical protein|nr:hypothetical protein [Methanoregula sp.]